MHSTLFLNFRKKRTFKILHCTCTCLFVPTTTFYMLHATCYMLHVYNSKVKLKVEFSVGLKTCHFIVL